MKPELTIENLLKATEVFCKEESLHHTQELFGITDGKAVGTYIEHSFKAFLSKDYSFIQGNSASGIDLPSPHVLTDIKVTSITQPQSSCPFKDAMQKIYGLGYNLLVFVYQKSDDILNKTSKLDFVHCTFIRKERTADYTVTFRLREMLKDGANTEDIIGFLQDKNIPADEIRMKQLAEMIIATPPEQGYLTISNALQWRLQYQRVIEAGTVISGVEQIVSRRKA